MNFNDLYKKIATIDSLQPLNEDGHAAIEECGMPMMPPQASPQQDSVSMTVSMNAQGKGGIRDLMNVLRDIEENVVDHEPAHIQHPEDDLVGKEVEIDGPANPIEIDHAEDDGEKHDMALIDTNPEEDDKEEPGLSAEKKIAGAIAAGAVGEEFQNRPNVSHQSVDFMTKDLSGGLNKQHKQAVRPGQPLGNNPMRESLVAHLQAMYEEVKSR